MPAEVFPPREPCKAAREGVMHERMVELERLAAAVFPRAAKVVARWYAHEPIVEVYAAGRARVLTREQVLVAQEHTRLESLGKAISASLAQANAHREVLS